MTGLAETLAAMAWRTPDGMPVSREPPYGATVVVVRPGADWGDLELLLLHRSHHGAGYEGDWAWGPPAGARHPGELPLECARRELREETGLELEPVPTGHGTAEWAVFRALAPPDAVVHLSPEHDRLAWLGVDEAVARCRPRVVGEQLRAAAPRT